jgi:hypothetical protein
MCSDYLSMREKLDKTLLLPDEEAEDPQVPLWRVVLCQDHHLTEKR